MIKKVIDNSLIIYAVDAAVKCFSHILKGMEKLGNNIIYNEHLN